MTEKPKLSTKSLPQELSDTNERPIFNDEQLRILPTGVRDFLAITQFVFGNNIEIIPKNDPFLGLIRSRSLEDADGLFSVWNLLKESSSKLFSSASEISKALSSAILENQYLLFEFIELTTHPGINIGKSFLENLWDGLSSDFLNKVSILDAGQRDVLINIFKGLMQTTANYRRQLYPERKQEAERMVQKSLPYGSNYMVIMPDECLDDFQRALETRGAKRGKPKGLKSFFSRGKKDTQEQTPPTVVVDFGQTEGDIDDQLKGKMRVFDRESYTRSIFSERDPGQFFLDNLEEKINGFFEEDAPRDVIERIKQYSQRNNGLTVLVRGLSCITDEARESIIEAMKLLGSSCQFVLADNRGFRTDFTTPEKVSGWQEGHDYRVETII